LQSASSWLINDDHENSSGMFFEKCVTVVASIWRSCQLRAYFGIWNLNNSRSCITLSQLRVLLANTSDVDDVVRDDTLIATCIMHSDTNPQL
jgi:hypothetical protein